MTIYPAFIRDLLANLARAAWTRATDSTRGLVVCGVCKCKRCKGER